MKVFVQEQPDRFDGASALGYALQVGNQEPAPDTVDIPGPLLVLTRGEPTSIAIINRSRVETSVHWHGMELESYFEACRAGAETDGESRHRSLLEKHSLPK